MCGIYYLIPLKPFPRWMWHLSSTHPLGAPLTAHSQLLLHVLTSFFHIDCSNCDWVLTFIFSRIFQATNIETFFSGDQGFLYVHNTLHSIDWFQWSVLVLGSKENTKLISNRPCVQAMLLILRELLIVTNIY